MLVMTHDFSSSTVLTMHPTRGGGDDGLARALKDGDDGGLDSALEGG